MGKQKKRSKAIFTPIKKGSLASNEKRKINPSITVNDRYKIQIYSGDSETSKKTLSEFRKENKDFDGTIVFNTPSYKVWIGNFKSRIEAERNLSEFKKRYPNALLIRPNK